MSSLSGKRAIITAGAGGIGRRIAERFTEEGATVFIGDISEEALSTLPADWGAAPVNVADEASTDTFYEAAFEALGGVDILVNAAGIAGPTGPLEETDPAAWRDCVDVNLVGAYLGMHRVLGKMKAQHSGSIVNFSSTGGLYGYENRTPYCASKWAIIGLSKAVAVEAGPYGIRCNAICPGAVEGERMDRVIAAAAETTGESENAVRAYYADYTSLKTFVTADDIAEMVVFICSDKGAQISGQALTVDAHTSML